MQGSLRRRASWSPITGAKDWSPHPNLPPLSISYFFLSASFHLPLLTLKILFNFIYIFCFLFLLISVDEFTSCYVQYLHEQPWHMWRSNIGLARCGNKRKREAECGMTEILKAGCKIKILRREQDLLTLTGGMWNSFKIGPSHVCSLI